MTQNGCFLRRGVALRCARFVLDGAAGAFAWRLYACFPPSTPLGPPGTLRASRPQREVSPSPGKPVRALPHPARSQAGGRACAQARRALCSDHWRSARRRGGTEAIVPPHVPPAHLTRAGCPGGKCPRGLFRAAARRRRPSVVVGSSHVSPSSIDPPSAMTVASRGFTSARCRGERPSRSRGLLGAPSIVVSPSVACHPTLRHCPRCAL